MFGVLISLLLLAGANSFAARLISVGTHPWIAQPRQALLKRKGPDHWLSELVTCPWCISAWTAAALTTVYWATGPVEHIPLPWWIGAPALAATLSYLYGLTASNLDPS